MAKRGLRLFLCQLRLWPAYVAIWTTAQVAMRIANNF